MLKAYKLETNQKPKQNKAYIQTIKIVIIPLFTFKKVKKRTDYKTKKHHNQRLNQNKNKIPQYNIY